MCNFLEWIKVHIDDTFMVDLLIVGLKIKGESCFLFLSFLLSFWQHFCTVYVLLVRLFVRFY